MKIPFYMFLLIIFSCSSNNITNNPSIPDDYIINFSLTDGIDIYEKGMSIGEEFYIYQNGDVLSFDIIYEKDNKHLKSWVLESSQIDSLHIIFKNTRFYEFPDIFPDPPIIGPTSKTSINYREEVTSDFKEINVFLFQDESGYPDGFYELYDHLRSICYNEK